MEIHNIKHANIHLQQKNMNYVTNLCLLFARIYEGLYAIPYFERVRRLWVGNNKKGQNEEEKGLSKMIDGILCIDEREIVLRFAFPATSPPPLYGLKQLHKCFTRHTHTQSDGSKVNEGIVWLIMRVFQLHFFCPIRKVYQLNMFQNERGINHIWIQYLHVSCCRYRLAAHSFHIS